MLYNKITIPFEADSTPIVEAEWAGQVIQIQKRLSFQEVLSFVDTVTEGSFMDGTGKYMPEATAFILAIATIDFYSNVALPDGLEDKYMIVRESGLIPLIQGMIDRDQYEEIIEAIDEKIANKLDAKSAELENLMDKLNVIEQQLEKIFGGIDGDTIARIAAAVVNGQFDEAKLVNSLRKNRAELEVVK